MPDAATVSWILVAVAMGVSAVWSVATIKLATTQLRHSIERLTMAIEKIESRQIDHEVRIALLERDQ